MIYMMVMAKYIKIINYIIKKIIKMVLKMEKVNYTKIIF